MSRDDEDGYDNRNRAFLQAFIARSTLTFDESKPILAAIFTAHEKRQIAPDDITQQDFSSYISVANHAISPYDMEIRSTLHQKTRERIYALVNSTSDPMSQLATSYSADEISFLKRVLDTMFETNNKPRREVMAIKGMQAVNLRKAPGGDRRRRTGEEMDVGDAGPGQTQTGADTQAETQGSRGADLTGREAERMLTALIDQGWFEKSKRGYYSLSPRALMELRGWLIEMYNDDDEEESDDERTGEKHVKIKFCYACKEIVTRGQRCPDWRCPARIHDICTEGFFTGRGTGCPICSKEWTGENFVGERADR